MRKSTVFISAVLTTFALVIVYNVASAYRENSKTVEIVPTPTTIAAPTATESPAPTDVAIGPVQAAQLASQVVGNTGLLSAESSTFNGVDAYLITFTNNDVVYVGLDGQILAVQVAPVVVNAAPAPKQNHKDGGQHVSSGGEEHHESSEDHHEEHSD